MSVCDDIRQVLIDGGISTAVESGGALACYMMPASPTYVFEISEYGGLRPIPVGSDTGTASDFIAIYGVQIRSRARQDQIETQETDMMAIRDLLHLKRNFVVNGHTYIAIEATTSGYLNLGWEGEDVSRVRYLSLNFEVRRSK